MKYIYIAARFGRAEEAKALSEELEKMGYNPTSTWYLPGQPIQVNSPTHAEEVEWNRTIAFKDYSEIIEADSFITLTEDMKNLPEGAARGGRHAEFGMAVALERRIALIGPREHVFHWLPEVQRWDTVKEFLNYLIHANHPDTLRTTGSVSKAFALPRKAKTP